MSEETKQISNILPVAEEEKTTLTKEDQKVVEEVMSERTEKKKPKRKVVKNNKALDDFVSSKKIRTGARPSRSEKKGAQESSTAVKILGATIVGAAIVGGLVYAKTQTKLLDSVVSKQPDLPPPGVNAPTAMAPQVPLAQRKIQVEDDPSGLPRTSPGWMV